MLISFLALLSLLKADQTDFQARGFNTLTMVGDGATDFEVRKRISCNFIENLISN